MKVAKLLAVVAVLGLAGSAFAAEGDRPARDPNAPRPIRGQIVKVVDANIVVKVMAGRNAEAKEVTVTTDAKTTVKIDDAADKKVSDLKADMYVTITPAEGVAKTIVATTKAPERRRPAAPAAN